MKHSLGARARVDPTPGFVVGTYDRQGKPSVMTAASGGVCCSRPPCVAVSLRAATYSHGNLVARRAFTIRLPSDAQAYHGIGPFLGQAFSVGEARSRSRRR